MFFSARFPLLSLKQRVTEFWTSGFLEFILKKVTWMYKSNNTSTLHIAIFHSWVPRPGVHDLSHEPNKSNLLIQRKAYLHCHVYNCFIAVYYLNCVHETVGLVHSHCISWGSVFSINVCCVRFKRQSSILFQKLITFSNFQPFFLKRYLFVYVEQTFNWKATCGSRSKHLQYYS